MKGGDLQRVAVGDRTPDPFVGPGQHLHAADLADVGPVVIELLVVEEAEQVGRAHRREPVIVDLRAREEGAFRVDDRRLAGTDREAEGANHAVGIDEGMDHHQAGHEARLLDPDRAEDRRLLALGVRDLHGERARHQSGDLSFRHGMEEVRSLEAGDLAEDVPLALGRQHAEPGKADIADPGGWNELPEVEERGVVDDPVGFARRDEEQVDPVAGLKTPVKRLHDETDVFGRPDARFGLEMDARILVVVQGPERVGQLRRDRLERLFGERARHVGQRGDREIDGRPQHDTGTGDRRPGGRRVRGGCRRLPFRPRGRR